MKNPILYCLPFFFAISCNVHEGQQLRDNPHIQSVFNESEIDALEMILNYFENQVCPGTSENLAACFQAFMAEAMDTNSGALQLRLDSSELKRVIQTLPSESFDAIWRKGSFRESGAPYIYLGPNTKFFSFLDSVSSSNNFIKDVHETIDAAGEITPSLSAGIAMKSELIDANNPENRLVVSLHYISLFTTYGLSHEWRLEVLKN